MLWLIGSMAALGAWYDEPPMAVDPERLLDVAAERPPEDDGFTFLLDDRTLRFDEEGRLTTTVHYVYRIDHVGEGGWTTNAPSWYPWFQERPTGDVRVVATDGTETHLDPATLMEHVGATGGGMYSDEHRLGAPLPALAAGVVVEEVWTVREHRATSLAGSSAVVGLDAVGNRPRYRVRVEAPAGLPLRWTALGATPPTVHRSREGGVQRLAVDLVDEEAPPAWTRTLPLVTPVTDALAVTVAPSWRAVAEAWRREAEPMADPAGWEALVAEVKAAPDRVTAVTTATRGVQDVVRYTGLELGARSIVPWRPSEVKARGYGDCKDQATAVVAVLRAAGLKADVALLRRGFDPEPAELLPGLGHFNHAIVHVPGAPELWVDVTEPGVAIGDLPRDDQDRWALVASPDARELVRTPSYPGELEIHTVADLTRPGFGLTTEQRDVSGWLGHDLRATPEAQRTLLDWDRRVEETSRRRDGPLLAFTGPTDPRVNDPVVTVATWRTPVIDAFGGQKGTIAVPQGVLAPLQQIRVPEDDEADAVTVRVLPFRATGTWTWRLPPGVTLERTPEDWSTAVGPYAVAIDWTVVDHELQARIDASITGNRATVAEARRLGELLGDADDHLDPRLALRDALLAAADDGHATDALAVARRAAPDDVEGRLALVRLLVRLGQLDAAQVEADALGATFPDDVRVTWARLWTRWPSATDTARILREDRAEAIAIATALWARGEPAAGDLLVDLLADEGERDGEVRRDEARRILEVAAEARARGTSSVAVREAEAVALAVLGRWADLRDLPFPPATSATHAARLLAVARTDGPDGLRTALQAIPDGDRAVLSKQLVSLSTALRAFDVTLQLARAEPDAASHAAHATIALLERVRPWTTLVDEGGAKGRIAGYLATTLAGEPAAPAAAGPALVAWQARVAPTFPPKPQRAAAYDASVDFFAAAFAAAGDDGHGGARWTAEVLPTSPSLYVAGVGDAARVVATSDTWPLTAAVALGHATHGRRDAAEAWYGWLRKDLRKDDPAVEAVRKLLPPDPPEGRALDELLTVLAAVAEPKRAAAAWRVASARPGDEGARLALLALLAAGGADDDALVGTIADALAARPHLPDDVTRALAVWIDALDLHEVAVTVGARLRAAHPDEDLWALLQTGGLRNLGRDAEAVALDRALVGPARQTESNNLAWSLLLLGKPQEAVDEMQGAVSARRGGEGERHTLACALLALGRADDAQRVLDGYLSGTARVGPHWWYVIGRLAEGWDLPDAARAAYHRVKVDPTPGATWQLARARLDVLDGKGGSPRGGTP